MAGNGFIAAAALVVVGLIARRIWMARNRPTGRAEKRHREDGSWHAGTDAGHHGSYPPERGGASHRAGSDSSADLGDSSSSGDSGGGDSGGGDSGGGD